MSGVDPLALVCILACLGFLMLAAEVFVPGMVIGTLGLLSLAASVVVGYAGFGPMAGTLLLAGVSVVTLVGFVAWMKMFPSTPIGRRIMLSRQLERGESTAASAAESIVGMEGEATSPLRPSGMARIGGHRVDVVAESRFVEPGERVVVVAQRDLRIIVRPLEDPPASVDASRW